MAVGTPATAVFRRDEIIAEAFAKVRAATTDGSYSMPEVDRAIRALNRILRKEDLRGVGGNTHLWAMSEAALFLVADTHTYSSTNNLKSDILDIHSIVFRDNNGADTPIELIDSRGWGNLREKGAAGDPTKVYFKRDRLLSSQQFYLDYAPDSVNTTDEVTGTDALNYKCILKHESIAANRPITGADWKLYWKQEGSSGSAWATATDYANGELLLYTYKRPLFDFDSATDNPDMPLGWETYLIYQLAHDLAANYGLPLQERAWLKSEAKSARDELFPSSRSGATDKYNRGTFF
jgi:hypothetical protein